MIKVLGYTQLPDTPPLAPVTARVRPEAQRGRHALRRAVAALGYQETINFSFVEARWEQELAGNADPIPVLNPIASPLSVMRSSLIGSLVAVLQYNLARRAQRVRIFELGRVFRRDASVTDTLTTVAGVSQPMRLSGLAHGPAQPLQWGAAERVVDFFDVKADVEALLAPRRATFVAAQHPALHPGRSARIELDGQPIGWIGELHPKWRQGYDLPQAPVLFELDADVLQAQVVPVYQPIAKQQSVWRDLALVVKDTVAHDALIGVITDDGSGLVRHAQLFDIYKPKAPTADIDADERSMAVRVELLDDNATLTDERVDTVVAGIVERLGQRLQARLRG